MIGVGGFAAARSGLPLADGGQILPDDAHVCRPPADHLAKRPELGAFPVQLPL